MCLLGNDDHCLSDCGAFQDHQAVEGDRHEDNILLQRS